MDNVPDIAPGGVVDGSIENDDTIGMNAVEVANPPVVSADWGGRGCRVIGCTEDI
jgi:hypothetical protein